MNDAPPLLRQPGHRADGGEPCLRAPFDPPMTGFRSDPYDNQSGECEVDGVGLYGDTLDTRKELVNYELL